MTPLLYIWHTIVFYIKLGLKISRPPCSTSTDTLLKTSAIIYSHLWHCCCKHLSRDVSVQSMYMVYALVSWTAFCSWPVLVVRTLVTWTAFCPGPVLVVCALVTWTAFCPWLLCLLAPCRCPVFWSINYNFSSVSVLGSNLTPIKFLYIQIRCINWKIAALSAWKY